MKYQKKVLAEINKCYAIAMFKGNDQDSFLIGTEKEGFCSRFDLEGNLIETIQEWPGGVMTMIQVPWRNDQFLSTQEFYSPNCGGDNARIVVCTKQADGGWKTNVLCDLPYVHRFGLLRSPTGQYYILACTIKSACKYKEDWHSPGKIYAAPLPNDLCRFHKNNQLQMEMLCDNQLKNHGYYTAENMEYALISTQNGVFKYVPPDKIGENWTVTCLLEEPVSDITQVDFDGDGKLELLTMSPFHGQDLKIYHLDENGQYTQVYQCPKPLPFLHAVWSGNFNGTKCAIIGHRKGDRDLFRIYYQKNRYVIETIDHDCGPANVWVYSHAGKERIIATNRETNEVALYTAES